MIGLLLIACLKPERPPTVEQDTDTDADSDTDADADSDTDSDTDSDADSDTDGPTLDAPSTVDFGDVGLGCDDVRNVRIQNPGNAVLEINELTAGGAFTLPNNDPFDVAAGAHGDIAVRFAPVVEQVYTTPLTVSSNAGEATVELIGQGVPLEGGQTFVQTENLIADVLIVVDNSCSMTEEQSLLQNNVSTLLTELDDIGADYQIGVITTDMDLTNPQRGRFVGPMVTNTTPNRLSVLQGQVVQGTGGSADEKPLDAIAASLTPPQINGINGGFLRTGAQVTAVVLTDEDDVSTLSATDFATEFEQVQSDPLLTTMSGLSGPPGGVLACNGGAVSGSPAPKLFEAALGTGGGFFDLCAVSQWDNHMRSLARAATGHRLAFPLSPLPNDPNSLEVTIDGTDVPEGDGDGFVYFQGVVFIVGSWVPDAGQVVRITHDNAPTSCP